MGSRFDHEPGDVIACGDARYLVKKQLGAGGMGACYLVEEVDFPRPFVLKTLNAEYRDREDLKRGLVDEGKVLAKLFGHANIVQAFRGGMTRDGLPYYLMEVLTGESVRSVLKSRKRIDIDAAVGIAIGVARALQHAHHHQVIHRDIKPENVILHRDVQGSIVTKLIDFGIFQALAAAAGFEGAVGTAAYMAPEQLRNEEITYATDLFAVGIMLWEMITGEHPFKRFGLHAKGAIARMNVQPESLRAAKLDAPAEVIKLLDEIIAGCTHPAPKRRWNDATTLEAKLTAVKRLLTAKGHVKSAHEAITTPGDVPPEVMAQLTGIVDDATLAPGTDPDMAIISPRGDRPSPSMGLMATTPEAGKAGRALRPAQETNVEPRKSEVSSAPPSTEPPTKPPSQPLPEPDRALAYEPAPPDSWGRARAALALMDQASSTMQAARRPQHNTGRGAQEKMCPRCGRRYEGSDTAFCGEDGEPLVDAPARAPRKPPSTKNALVAETVVEGPSYGLLVRVRHALGALTSSAVFLFIVGAIVIGLLVATVRVLVTPKTVPLAAPTVPSIPTIAPPPSATTTASAMLAVPARPALEVPAGAALEVPVSAARTPTPSVPANPAAASPVNASSPSASAPDPLHVSSGL